MSETVHYRGIATKIPQPNDKSLVEVAEDILQKRKVKVNEIYDDAIEQLCDEFYEEYFYYKKTQTLYSIKGKKTDNSEDIADAEVISPDKVRYELKFYNGGAGFTEVLEWAFDEANIK